MFIRNRSSAKLRLLALVTVLLPPLGVAGAQQVGVVRGTILDAATERPLPNASVAVNSALRSTTTDTAGVFRVTALPEGLYTIEVRRIGYRPARQVNVRVTREKTTMVDFHLTAAAVQLEAVYAASAALG